MCSQIRSKLKEYNLSTEPNFQHSYIDGYISFVRVKDEEISSSESTGGFLTDPTYRIGRLESANNSPVRVSPDSTIQEAVTLMMSQDFSQLPVMTTERDVKGIISWKTIGCRLALKKKCEFVRDCMETAQIVDMEESLFSAIKIIAEYDYVLVKAQDRSICGIITASDFNIQFQILAEPFLLVGEIENGVRQILHGKYTKKEIEEAKVPGDDDRVIDGVSDLTFGEYIRLMDNEARWKKLKIELDRVEFIKRLNRIREIRNDVMHFDTDGLEEDDLEVLREFAHFMKRLREAGVV